jgi:hypothetical protein
MTGNGNLLNYMSQIAMTIVPTNIMSIHPAAPLTCDAIRINMVPQSDAAVGILEVQVAFEK